MVQYKCWELKTIKNKKEFDMKETIKNLKKVYKYGKQYKSGLIWQIV